MAILFHQDGSMTVYRNQPRVCCAERLALREGGNDTGVFMLVVKVQMKRRGWSIGSSRPCQRCVEALRLSSVQVVVWSEKQASRVSFQVSRVPELPYNTYISRA